MKLDQSACEGELGSAMTPVGHGEQDVSRHFGRRVLATSASPLHMGTRTVAGQAAINLGDGDEADYPTFHPAITDHPVVYTAPTPNISPGNTRRPLRSPSKLIKPQ